jgi:SAM-dependent methyltransferase
VICSSPLDRHRHQDESPDRLAMVMDVLSAADRQKIDGSDDALFYAEPRFVQHLDAAFRARLTELYRERIPRNAVVLDLMGSWVSHLPEDGTYAEVIGHGLNERELQANPRLSRHWVQNLNTNQHLPLDDASVDAALVVAGWQYLQQPEAIAAELLRVVRPGGALIIAFSNRMFAQKAPRIWLEGSDRDRLASVARVLIAQGWPRPELLAEATRHPGPLGWMGGKGDPFFAVIATRPLQVSPTASAASAPAAP